MYPSLKFSRICSFFLACLALAGPVPVCTVWAENGPESLFSRVLQTDIRRYAQGRLKDNSGPAVYKSDQNSTSASGEPQDICRPLLEGLNREMDLLNAQSKGKLADPTTSRLQTIWNAAGAAIGGFFGVLLFEGVRGLFLLWSRRPRRVKFYPCAGTHNRGQPEETEGELLHHYGSAVTEKDVLKGLNRGAAVWEWNRQPTGKEPTGFCVIYGPYASDCNHPGMYHARFWIGSFDVPTAIEIQSDKNLILFELDVNKVSEQHEEGKSIQRIHERRHRSYVRTKDLSEGTDKHGWKKFDLSFSSDGTGLWEYRVFAFDGKGKPEDNIKAACPNARFFFDKIEVFLVKGEMS